jgi:hypothetical protein
LPFTPDDNIVDGCHAWALVVRSCSLDEPGDPLLAKTVLMLREAYGEERIMSLVIDPGVDALFDTEAIRAALRMGFPDPEAEGDKPVQLSNYRSEVAEVLARGALEQVHSVEFPASPQLGKTNANMPILGFDGWGILRNDTGNRLVLVQVKATDDKRVPPQEATKLRGECQNVPKDTDKLARAISVLLMFLRGTDHVVFLLGLLQELGQGKLPQLSVAPVIVRGTTCASLEDLEPIRSISSFLEPVQLRGVAISLGVDLALFARRVIERARAA